ncbi:MAG: hypothetical protein DHS80DRAFT_16126 [Piptocephalis tieghemiana]|nr:MAG: hypothetical protein DHS80DRAFT_16126 [Piptocephalis tieghemiana]
MDQAITIHATSNTVPPPLAGASTTTVGDTLYLFGGRLVSTRKMTNELYTLNLTTLVWKHHPSIPGDEAPEPRYFHSADVVSNGRILIFGGMGQRRSASSASSIISSSTTSTHTPPPVASTDTSVVLNDIVILETAGGRLRWVRPPVQGPSPAPRYAHLTTASPLALNPIPHLRIIGGQDLRNNYVEEVFELNLASWTWSGPVPLAKQCGVYRSVTLEWQGKLLLYSNYNFTNVKRELQALGFHEGVSSLRDLSTHMTGAPNLPPGLRFPSGHLCGEDLVVCGTYLTNTANSFSIWRLHLPTLTWSRLEVDRPLGQGSWNRAILDLPKARLLLLGHRSRSLLPDYEHRRVNFDHIAAIQLEAWGIHPPVPFPHPSSSPSSIASRSLGSLVFTDQRLADFTLYARAIPTSPSSSSSLSPSPSSSITMDTSLSSDQPAVMAIPVNSEVLRLRWPHFSRLIEASSQADRASRSLTLPVPHPVLLAMIRVLYTMSLDPSLPLGLLSALLVLADKYGAPQVALAVRHQLHLSLTPNAALEILVAARRAGYPGLRLRALHVLLLHPTVLVNNRYFWSDLDPTIRQEILSWIPLEPPTLSPLPPSSVTTVSSTPPPPAAHSIRSGGNGGEHEVLEGVSQ